MQRLIWPGLMAAMTAYVWNHNATSADSKLLFPFIESIMPSTKGDPVAMGEASVYGFGIVTLLFLIEAIVKMARDRPSAKSSDEAE
jgi:hypothetical protein